MRYVEDVTRRSNMKIGIDVDSVVAETMPSLLERINKKWNTSFRKEDVTDWDTLKGVTRDGRKITINMGNEIGDAFSDDHFLLNLKTVDGARMCVDLLKIKHSVMFITSRSPRTMAATKAWINKHFGEYEIRHCDKDKNGFNVDVLIDDYWPTIEKFHGVGILFRQPWNTKFSDPKKNFAENWLDVMQIIIDLDRLEDKEWRQLL